jgi:hypothetical protein
VEDLDLGLPLVSHSSDKYPSFAFAIRLLEPLNTQALGCLAASSTRDKVTL